MHKIKADLLKLDKKLIDIISILNGLTDPYDWNTPECKGKLKIFLKTIETMKQELQPLLSVDYTKLEEEYQEKGKIDINRIKTSNNVVEKTDHDAEIKETFEMLTREQAQVKIEDLIEKSGLANEIVEEWIKKQKASGDIFEPQERWIQKL